jgi:1-pyrroline-4-hydroxy-2-carboxylate deaminase
VTEASIARGVTVAITTPFAPDGAVDPAAFVAHARWLFDRGIRAVVVAGSLGEGASLSPDERIGLVDGLARSSDLRVLAAVGSARTAGAVDLACRSVAAGASGLLLLPPYVYRPDAREVRAHFAAVLGATDRPCVLYNNPAAYGTDVRPEEVLALAEEHANLVGVKESSGDVRRITELRALLGGRVDIAVGLDDAVVEGIAAGAVGWVAGLANALPEESLALFDRAVGPDPASAWPLYDWFRPLLRLDTMPKFVQLIKLVEAERSVGSTRVRPPRLELDDLERERALALIRERLTRRPDVRAPSDSPARASGTRRAPGPRR